MATVITITSLSDFTVQIEAALARTGGLVWYRGSGRTSYLLLPGLYRHPTISTAEELLQLEIKILNRFKQRSVPHIGYSTRTNWEYLFLMQHSRVPTRLLDWTENPYIALYFALTSALGNVVGGTTTYTEDAAVWVLDPASWNRKALDDISYAGTVLSAEDEELRGHEPARPASLVKSEPVAMYGTYNSARIVAQRGVFTVFGKSLNDMEHTHTTNSYPTESLLKLVIPAVNIESVLAAIIGSGITDSVVYPDLDGLALEIRRYFKYPV